MLTGMMQEPPVSELVLGHFREDRCNSLQSTVPGQKFVYFPHEDLYQHLNHLAAFCSEPRDTTR